MTYHLDRRLFLENGPTLLAERDRQLRATGHIYRLLAARPEPVAEREARNFSAAA